MAATFKGFSPEALSFFRKLERNNKREWFQPRKAFYDEHVRGPMLELVAAVNDDLRAFAADHVTEPAKAVYRIYRDTRFSKDKTPYKTHVGALFVRTGLPKHGGANYYVGVSHKGVEVAGGMYMPGPDELAAVRRAIADNEPAFRKLVTDRALRKALGDLQGERLARVPRGFDPASPAAEFLRLKQAYFYVTLPADLATGPSVRREVVKRFKAVTPFVNWINETILRATRDDGDDARPVRPAPMF